MNVKKKKFEPRLYEIGGSWGDAIFWNGGEQFGEKPLTDEHTFSCHGWKSDMPRVGDHLRGEFVRSWMTFEFTEVEPCQNPRDMFFAKVKPIKQEMK